MENVPDAWCYVPLSEVVSINPGVEKSRLNDEDELPFVPMPAVEAETGRIDTSERRPFSEVKTGFTSFSSGDVLFAKITPCMENGKMAVVPSLPSGVGFGSTEFHVLRPSGAIDGQLLYYFVSSSHVRHEAQHQMTGAVGQKRVPKRYLETKELPLPPLNEQRRIVDKIESLFVQLDHGEASLRDVQKLLARYRQSVLKAAVTGQLTADWRAENAGRLESGRDLLERTLQARRENWQGRGRYKEPAAPDTSDLPELPEGWVWASFEQLFDVYGGATPSRKDSKNWNGDIPWVSSGEVAFCRIKNTEEKITEAGYQSCSTKLHPEGTVLLAMIGEGKTRGQAAILDIPACNNQNSAAIRVSESGIPCDYVYYYLMGRYQESRKAGQGGNQPALNGSKVKSFVMPLPSIDEMREIATRVDEAFYTSEALATWCETELTRSAALRQSILKDAFAGKLVPQDPDDEPASELLASIRAAREAELKKPNRRKSCA